jgi:hypothetical protein
MRMSSTRIRRCVMVVCIFCASAAHADLTFESSFASLTENTSYWSDSVNSHQPGASVSLQHSDSLASCANQLACSDDVRGVVIPWGAAMYAAAYGDAGAVVTASMSQIYFDSDPNIAKIRMTLTANGHGITTTGTGSAQASSIISLNGHNCTLALDGSVGQVCSVEVSNTYQQNVGFSLTSSFNVSGTGSSIPGDSAVIDYWGTFDVTATTLDASGNVLQELQPPSNVPEPGTLTLLLGGVTTLMGTRLGFKRAP